MDILDPEEQATIAKSFYQKGNFIKAAEGFSVAQKSYQAQNLPIKAAEMANNKSVALLQSGNHQAALDAVLGTDKIFES